MPRPILVVGVSRSGTSLVTSLLAASEGVGRFDHGHGTGHGDWRTTSGYKEWETHAAYVLNEKVLRAYGRSWAKEKEDGCYAPLLVPGQAWPSKLVAEARGVIAELRSSLPNSGPLLLKDPRFAWTLGLWADAMRSSAEGEAPVLVLVARSPLANAASLHKHEQWSRPLQRWEGTLRLSLNATLTEAERRCGGSSARPDGYAGVRQPGCGSIALVSFSQLMRDPEAALSSLLARLAVLGVDGLRRPPRTKLRMLVSPHEEPEGTSLREGDCVAGCCADDRLTRAQLQLARQLEVASDELEGCPTPDDSCGADPSALRYFDRSCDARLVIRRSSTLCTMNVTFGCIASGEHGASIWVDGGCRGRFDCGDGRFTNCGEQYYSRRRWTCPCRTPDNESRSMSSLLRREDRSALGAHRGPVVVITHTHTMRLRAALILAREQLSAHHLFHHHVALRADSQARCATMRAMLPFSENVSCIGAATIAALLPAIGQSGRLFSRQKPTFHSRVDKVAAEDQRSRASWARGADLGVGSYQWSWSNCDATYLGWAALSGLARTPRARWFWFLEWDVTWSGNIATILAAYHGHSGGAGGRPSKGRARSEDLLCDLPLPARPQTTAGYKHMKNRRGLPHLIERNRSEYALDVVWNCVIQLTRLSARLLRHVIAQSRRPELGMFCEMRAATMCSVMADSVHPPCVIGNVALGRQERFFETRRRLHDAKRHPTFNWHSVLPRDRLIPHCPYSLPRSECPSRSLPSSAAGPCLPRCLRGCRSLSPRWTWAFTPVFCLAPRNDSSVHSFPGERLYHRYKWKDAVGDSGGDAPPGACRGLLKSC